MFTPVESRTIKCPVCDKKATEPFFGVGFPGWLRLMSVVDPETQVNPIICPDCKKSLTSWLNKQSKIIPVKIKKEK